MAVHKFEIPERLSALELKLLELKAKAP